MPTFRTTLVQAGGNNVGIDVPALAAALADAGLPQAFDALAYSHRKEHARSVDEAKKAETRERRVAKVLEQLR